MEVSGQLHAPYLFAKYYVGFLYLIVTPET